MVILSVLVFNMLSLYLYYRHLSSPICTYSGKNIKVSLSRYYQRTYDLPGSRARRKSLHRKGLWGLSNNKYGFWVIALQLTQSVKSVLVAQADCSLVFAVGFDLKY